MASSALTQSPSPFTQGYTKALSAAEVDPQHWLEQRLTQSLDAVSAADPEINPMTMLDIYQASSALLESIKGTDDGRPSGSVYRKGMDLLFSQLTTKLTDDQRKQLRNAPSWSWSGCYKEGKTFKDRLYPSGSEKSVKTVKYDILGKTTRHHFALRSADGDGVAPDFPRLASASSTHAKVLRSDVLAVIKLGTCDFRSASECQAYAVNLMRAAGGMVHDDLARGADGSTYVDVDRATACLAGVCATSRMWLLGTAVRQALPAEDAFATFLREEGPSTGTKEILKKGDWLYWRAEKVQREHEGSFKVSREKSQGVEVLPIIPYKTVSQSERQMQSAQAHQSITR